MGSIPTYSRQREPERQRCSGFCAFQPLSQTFGLPAPRPGSLLDCASTNYKPALKGDSSRARPVGDAARGESGGIGSIASSSEARRPYSNQRCGCECNEQTEGLHQGCSYLRQPLSQSALRRIASSPAGEPFGTRSTPNPIDKPPFSGL